MNRPTVDESLCFICQREAPTWNALKNNGEHFKLCNSCKEIVQMKNMTDRRIEMALMYPDNGTKIFSETLGMHATVPEFRFTKL